MPSITGRLAAATSAGAAAEQEVSQDAARLDDAWMTIVWNDPVNLMTYVTYVFQSYFGYSTEHAEKLMLEVHNAGRAVVSSGGRERVERDVQAMHDYGLWATMQRVES